MKKLINAPEAVLADALVGVEAAHSDLTVDHKNRIIYRATPKADGKVALVSGGGSGHEPLHGQARSQLPVDVSGASGPMLGQSPPGVPLACSSASTLSNPQMCSRISMNSLVPLASYP